MPRLVVESDHEAAGIVAEYDRAVGIGRRSDKPVADRFDVEQGPNPLIEFPATLGGQIVSKPEKHAMNKHGRLVDESVSTWRWGAVRYGAKQIGGGMKCPLLLPQRRLYDIAPTDGSGV